MRLLNKLQLARKLGFRNIAVVFWYRITIKFGIQQILLPVGVSYDGRFFNAVNGRELPTLPQDWCAALDNEVKAIASGEMRYFSAKQWNIGSPPDWFLNPLTENRVTYPKVHWSKIGDFTCDAGDIKGVWEASRFDWVLTLVRAYLVSRNNKYLDLLNTWLSNWVEKNPWNRGPNWKCGQETAIRLLQILLAAHLLQQDKRMVSKPLVRFVQEHCYRIKKNFRYAIAQNNNHGTSEAAALFVGGLWLARIAESDNKLYRKAMSWQRMGRRWLENRVEKLIEPDGSFSQYSVNYHRVLLDTLNIAEFWRRQTEVSNFSDTFYERARAATDWLYQMVDPISGDAPNVGANDGARLFALTSTVYRDYRPSVQLSSVLFCGGSVYGDGGWDEPLVWLGLEDDAQKRSELKWSSRYFPNGGYVKFQSTPAINRSQTWGVLRFPNFRFRPSHADGLHLDVWHKGQNLLRDGGSFSYNAQPRWLNYFAGAAAHNTIQFDGRDQMPRLGRFLFGEWLRIDEITPLITSESGMSWSGSYVDYKGGCHKRTVTLQENLWRVVDEVKGFQSKAVLRWRLLPGKWHVDGFVCSGDKAKLSVKVDVPVERMEIVEGWESRHYFEKTPIPVLEVEIAPKRGRFETEIHFQD